MADENLGTLFATVELRYAGLRAARGAVDRDLTAIQTSLSRVETQLARLGKQMENQAGRLSRLEGLRTLQGALAGVSTRLLQAGRDSFKMASDYQESLSKARVIFKDHAAGIEAWSRDSAKSFGLARGAALEASSTFGNLFVNLKFGEQRAAGMSTRLVQLAADLASFNNKSVEDALGALRSGLAGESEPLRAFGVFLSDAVLQAKALEMGLIKTKQNGLDPAIKAMASYQIILDQTKNAQGDFARTADGAANKQRILRAEFENAATTLGNSLLPAGTKLLDQLARLTGAFNRLEPETRSGLASFAVGAGVFTVAAAGVATLIVRVAELKTALATLAIPRAALGALGAVGAVAGGAAGLGALGMGIGRNLRIGSQNAINDAALPPFVETAGELADERDRLGRLREQLRRTRTTGFRNETRDLEGKVAASEKRINMLRGIYQRQRGQFDRQERANGRPASRAKAPSAPSPFPTAPGGDGGKAKRLAESLQRAEEIAASGRVEEAEAAFSDALRAFQEGAAGMTDRPRLAAADRLRALSARIAARQTDAAKIRLGNAAAEDRPAAEATYRNQTGRNGEIARAVRDRERQVTDVLRDAHAERVRLQEEEEEKVKRSNTRAARHMLDVIDKYKREQARAAEDARERDDNVLRERIENGKIELREAVRIIDEKIKAEEEGSARWARLQSQRRAVLTMIARDEEKKAKEAEKATEDAADLFAAGARAMAKGATNTAKGAAGAAGMATGLEWRKDPFKFISESMARNVEAARLSFSSLQDFIGSTMEAIKNAFAAAVGEMAAKWAAVQLGANAGSAVAGPLGSVFGSIVGGLTSSFLGPLFGGRSAPVPVNPARYDGGRAYHGGAITVYATLANGYDTQRLARDLARHTRQEARTAPTLPR